MTVLGLRVLNRTLLERQRLHERVDASVPSMVEHLAGMQAQNPDDPYVSLWTRIRDFDPNDLSKLIERRRIVRASLMRSTIHLVTARDVLAFRPLVQTRLERSFHGARWGKMLDGVDSDEVLAFGHELIAQRPHTTSDLREALGTRFPAVEAEAIVMLVKYVVPSVQVPPRGMWGQTAHPAWAAMETWLGKPLATPRPDRFLLRYLAAFGPATLADFRNWSGLTGYNDVAERLRPKLRTFRDDKGRELLDVLDAPIADADLPAPPRFFGDYDNVFLGHADRSRIVEGVTFKPGTYGTSSFSVDGFLAGTWKLARRKRSVTMSIEPFKTLRKRDRIDLEQEAESLLAFLAPDAERYLRFV